MSAATPKRTATDGSAAGAVAPAAAPPPLAHAVRMFRFCRGNDFMDNGLFCTLHSKEEEFVSEKAQAERALRVGKGWQMADQSSLLETTNSAERQIPPSTTLPLFPRGVRLAGQRFPAPQALRLAMAAQVAGPADPAFLSW